MFSHFTNHFFRIVWRVKSVILALVALVVAGAVAITLVASLFITLMVLALAADQFAFYYTLQCSRDTLQS